MKCTNPINLQGPESGILTVPCGKCISCRVNKTQEWGLRILHEAKSYDSSVFVTLTYKEECLPVGGSVDKRDLQLFLKRLRKVKRFRYFACGEYGENYFRPHYHLIMFGLSMKDRDSIEKAWDKGFVHLGHLSIQSAQYCAKYVQKQLGGIMSATYKDLGIKKEFMLCSKGRKQGEGIGGKFSEKYIDNWIKKGYIILEGTKRPIPRYYLNRVSDEELEEFKRMRQLQKFDRIIEKEVNTGKNVYEQIDDAVASRAQNDKNIKAQLGLKISRLNNL